MPHDRQLLVTAIECHLLVSSADFSIEPMPYTYCTELTRFLARIDQDMAEAERLMIARTDDDTLQLAYKALIDLQALKRNIEAKLYLLRAEK
jgi:hypothetical protein